MHPIERDRALIIAGIAGDMVARERLLRAWLPQVIAWCKRLCGPRIDPDDVFQDVAEKVLTRMQTVREPDAFPGWLFQVVRSQANRHRRKAWMKRWIPGITTEGTDQGPSPERSSGLSEISRQVQQVLEELPDAQREVLVLCFIEERSHSEVAEMLDLPIGTVKSRMRLARERFAREAQRISPSLGDVIPALPPSYEHSQGAPP